MIVEGDDMAATKGRLPKTKRRSKVVGMAGRKREKEPDPTTPEGQWALHLRSLLPATFDIDHFADEIGYGRAMVFKWIRGDAVPHVRVWAEIATYLNLPGWWSLAPSADFIKSLAVPKKGRKQG